MISIVLPTHRRPESLRRCLNELSPLVKVSLINVVVIMDGSDDETLGLRDSYSDSGFYYLIGDGSLFWGGAIERGMEFAFSELNSKSVIWLNDDTNFSHLDVQKFVQELDGQYDIVGARLFGNNVNRNIYNVDRNIGIKEVSYVNGNFTSISKEVFDKIGNIESNKFPHFADAPYIEKAITAGYKIYCNTNVTVNMHYDVLRHINPSFQFFLRKNGLSFLKWMFFDVRSKWYIKYRINYCVNKNSFPYSYIRFILSFVKDWGPMLFLVPLSFVINKDNKMRIVKWFLEDRISNFEVAELEKEVLEL